MSLKPLIAVAAVALLVPATSFAQSTRYGFDQMATFNNAKTYTLKVGTKAGVPVVDQHIVSDIESQLQAKGLRQSNIKPDLVIVYHVAFTKPEDIANFSTGMFGYGPYKYQWGPGWGSTDVRVSNIAVGTLVIDVIDTRTNSLIWRGIGVKSVDPQDTGVTLVSNLEHAVASILTNYPPKPVVMSTR